MNAPAHTVSRALEEAGKRPSEHVLKQARNLYWNHGHSLQQSVCDTVRKHWNRDYPTGYSASRKEFLRRRQVIRDYLKSLPRKP